MLIALFSTAVAAASSLAFGGLEAGLAIGLSTCVAMWLGKRALSGA